MSSVLVDLRTAAPAVLASLPRTVVVGSGAAGTAVALALEDAGRRVLLVESGGDPKDAAGTAKLSSLNAGEVVGHPYGGLEGGRSRTLGGATQLWLGQCTRLLPLDLAARPWVVGSGWPLAAADLDRWYGRAEGWFQVRGGSYGQERWAENPRIAPLPWDGEHVEADFSEYTDALHLGTRFRRRLEASSLVALLTHASVVRVVVSGDRAVGVDVREPGGASASLVADEVVLACGAVENARVLMLSDPEGVGLGTGRWHTGRHLQDHPVVETLEVEPVSSRPFQESSTTLHGSGRRLYPKVRLSAGAQREHELLNANASFLHHRSDPRVHAAKRLLAAAAERRWPKGVLRDVAAVVGAAGPLAAAAYRRRVRGVSGGPLADRITLQVWMEQAADPESRITLGRARDPLGLPVARVDWRVGEQEMRSSRSLSRWVAQCLERQGLARVRELPVMTDDDAWRRAVTDAYHPSGTTRMSLDPTQGVVDPDGAVHGVSGLHVAGSSTFPVAGFANPTLTTVALALRLADHLAAAPQHAPEAP